MKFYFILCSLLILSVFTYAQGVDREAKVVVIGHGKTLKEANQQGLRSAVEQAFGTFISSKTEIFNDQLMCDQVISVTSGNIKSFKPIYQDQAPDGSWVVSLEVVVSIDKLSSFMEAKGIAVEFKGNAFALNIKQQMLNEQSEYKAIQDLIGFLHEPLQVAYDYDIASSDPVSVKNDSKLWKIELTVTPKLNANGVFCLKHLSKSLRSIGLTKKDQETYRNLKKTIYNFRFDTISVYLRNKQSLVLLESLSDNFGFYKRLFIVECGSPSGSIYHELDGFTDVDRNKVSKNYIWERGYKNDYRYTIQYTLSEIEGLTGFKVKPLGVRSEFKHGGYLIYDNNGHGLVCAMIDLEKLPHNMSYSYEEAVAGSANYCIGGYCDWRLPTSEEIEIIRRFYVRYKVGGLNGGSYGSSSTKANGKYIRVDFNNGYPGMEKNWEGHSASIRLVRVY